MDEPKWMGIVDALLFELKPPRDKTSREVITALRQSIAHARELREKLEQICELLCGRELGPGETMLPEEYFIPRDIRALLNRQEPPGK